MSAAIAFPARTQTRNALVAALLMLFSAVTAWAMLPTKKLVDLRGKVALESAIPQRFGDWQYQKEAFAGIVNPQTTEKLSELYSQILTRTYRNSRGEGIMLSIAYGEDQRDGSQQLHYPEICYPAQGFQVLSNQKDVLHVKDGTIPVRRLETVLGPRHEPVTYWTIVGDYATLGGIDKKLVEMRHNLKGEIPDGLLFRVSSITQDSAAGFQLQDSFVRDLLDAVGSRDLHFLSGLKRG